MGKIKILDCTLRDGGYLLNGDFGDDTIRGIIQKMTEAKLDVVECGYLKDIPHTAGNCTFSKPEEVAPYLPKERANTSYVLLADYSRYSAETLSPFTGTSIDGIRECFQKHERYDAMRVAKKMKDYGYKVYIQPVDILYYSDQELLELISWVNEFKPYSFSMVDTFGSMYLDDLRRIFSLVNHNLNEDINMGFHSHNNLQLSAALSQEFIDLSINTKRDVVVDGTLCGMGRGAGNTCTELIVQYMNKRYDYGYDMDIVLDAIDIYMPRIEERCSWGYSIPFFIAGINNAHVHNISYLLDKHNTNAKNIRQIIEKIDPITRKKYDYDNLENIYINHISKCINDNETVEKLRATFFGQSVVLLIPGRSLQEENKRIDEYLKMHPEAITISVNHFNGRSMWAYFSNYRRYETYLNKSLRCENVILTSNIEIQDESSYRINYNDYIKQGWKHFDNSTIMLCRLLIKLGIQSINFAGFDGYLTNGTNNYSAPNLELRRDKETFEGINNDIQEMLDDISSHSRVKISFITNSIFRIK